MSQIYVRNGKLKSYLMRYSEYIPELKGMITKDPESRFIMDKNNVIEDTVTGKSKLVIPSGKVAILPKESTLDRFNQYDFKAMDANSENTVVDYMGLEVIKYIDDLTDLDMLECLDDHVLMVSHDPGFYELVGEYDPEVWIGEKKYLSMNSTELDYVVRLQYSKLNAYYHYKSLAEFLEVTYLKEGLAK